MNSKDIRFRVGLFVLGSLILLAALITAFSGFPSIFKQYNRYTIVFPEAPGVASGTPVRRSGVRIGEVASVRIGNWRARPCSYLGGSQTPGFRALRRGRRPSQQAGVGRRAAGNRVFTCHDGKSYRWLGRRRPPFGARACLDTSKCRVLSGRYA